MSKTGGGPGTNQYAVKGQGKSETSHAEASEVLVELATGGDGTDLFDPINQPYGATPVEEEAREELLEQHQGVETMAQLNALEAENIAKGLLWARGEGFDASDLLSQYVLREVHQHMFNEVWQWAGRLRQRELSIGIDPAQIQEQWKSALDDAAYWIENRTYGPAEVVLRLHHRTVWIHPFVNGNGRHARLMSEELALALGFSDGSITWGSHLGLATEDVRAQYLIALRKIDMDRNDVSALIALAVDPDAPTDWNDLN